MMTDRSGLNRRHFLAGGAALAATGGLWLHGGRRSYAKPLPAPAEAAAGKTVSWDLVAAERPGALPCFGGRTLPMWTFADNAWPPAVRIDLGDRLETRLTNRLPRDGEHTSIHWHGVRLPNDQDGVPYLVQPPVLPGESFTYSFVPPDTGTFFFHTHCNTVEQLGRGLLGLLIVDGDAAEPYDADQVLLLRDWRVDADDGDFLPFMTLRGAGRAGTYGPVRSCNGETNPQVALPSSGDCRLRVINLDPTRVMQVGVIGAEAAVVAIDGVAVTPFPLKAMFLAPAMRMDLVVRSPAEGATATVVDYFAAEPVTLATLVGTGPARRTAAFDPAPLRAGRIPEPDLANAERLKFSASASAVDQPVPLTVGFDQAPLGVLCATPKTFWAINHQSWPSRDHASIPPPLATLARGRSYVFELENQTSNMHPLHIHGHTFKVLSHSKQDIPVHHADTILLQPKETVEVAFVADNPGDWMFHCHIIEHQETGMMGYLRVA